MRARAAAFALTALLATSIARTEEPVPEDPAVALAAAVDLPTKEQRLAAAQRLAARTDVTLETWIDLARKFRPRGRVRAGPSAETAVLRVGDADETTKIDVYVPEGVAARPAPLLVALHGAGGEGHDEQELWRDAADKLGMIVVAPTDPDADLGLKYGDPPRRRVLAAIRWARRTFDVDESRVFLAGVSRGGHLAWDVALRNPDQFAALAPLIGAPRLHPAEGNNNLRYVENVVRLPIRDLQGAHDDPMLLANLKLAFARLASLGARDAQLILQADKRHDFDPHAVDWVKFLGGAARPALPLKVVRAAARLDEARAGWAEILRFAPTVDDDFRVDLKQSAVKDADEETIRRLVEAEVEKKTARLEVSLDAPGAFTATASLVQKFRILLAEDMFEPAAPVTVTFNGRAVKYAASPSKLVLLREFVERFDRTFLPVAEVSCP